MADTRIAPDVYTVKAYRGQGLVSELLNRIIVDARKTETWQSLAIGLKAGQKYKKLGFDDEQSDLDVYMEWYE